MSGNKITRSQLSAFHVLLAKHNLKDDKENIVRQITKGRTASSAQMTSTEAREWIKAMNNKQEEDEGKRMRNHIIAMAYEMGWIKRETVVTPDGVKTRNNYSSLHDWIKKYGYLKKDLNKYTYTELPTLVSQFKKVYFSIINKKST